jgi:glucoamylase
VQLRNRAGEHIQAAALVSMDFSWLTRLGLRSAADPRIRDTITVVDRVLKVDTPSGPVYHRYNEDGYGEHADGSPFDGTGIGRGWPLLVGERGHLALQSGVDPLAHLQVMWRCSSAGGLLPEQVWDTEPIAALGLAPGRPSGSAMPLLWTHAEFLKLLVARERGRPVELLQAVERRYGGEPVRAATIHWRDEVPLHHLDAGRALLIEAREPFTLRLGFDGWQRVVERAAMALPFGLWGARLEAAELAGARTLEFTRHYAAGWEGRDHALELDCAGLRQSLSASGG